MSRRGWYRLAVLGVALVVLAMIVTALVLIDKPHFGFLVGKWFAPVITSGVLVGSLLLLIALWGLPPRKSWRWIVLLIWALIAITSPAFGFLFLAPWSVLVLMLPVVIVALVQLGRGMGG